MERHDPKPDRAVDGLIQLVKGGTRQGDDKKDGVTIWGGADLIVPYGGETDLWGLSWSDTDINAPNFGVAVSATCGVGLKDAKAYIDFLRITVYYTEGAVYYHGFKVQGVGELALCDVGTNPLRIRKGDVTYGVELVATDDPNASAVRIKTSAGVRAIRKHT